MTDFVFKVGVLIREAGYESRYGIITNMPTEDEILRDMREGTRRHAWVQYRSVNTGKYFLTHIMDLRTV